MLGQGEAGCSSSTLPPGFPSAPGAVARTCMHIAHQMWPLISACLLLPVHPDCSPKFTLRANRGLELPIHGDGLAVRSYLYVEDVADAYITVLLKGKVSACRGVDEWGSGREWVQRWQGGMPRALACDGGC